MNLIIRKLLFKFHMLFTDKHNIEKKVRLICKYDPLNILN